MPSPTLYHAIAGVVLVHGLALSTQTPPPGNNSSAGDGDTGSDATDSWDDDNPWANFTDDGDNSTTLETTSPSPTGDVTVTLSADQIKACLENNSVLAVANSSIRVNATLADLKGPGPGGGGGGGDGGDGGGTADGGRAGSGSCLLEIRTFSLGPVVMDMPGLGASFCGMVVPPTKSVVSSSTSRLLDLCQKATVAVSLSSPKKRSVFSSQGSSPVSYTLRVMLNYIPADHGDVTPASVTFTLPGNRQIHLTSASGYLSTPKYTYRYSADEQWYRLSVPTGRVVILSVAKMPSYDQLYTCVQTRDKLSLYHRVVSYGTRIVISCSSLFAFPRVYNTDTVYVHYPKVLAYSRYWLSHVKLQYSYHSPDVSLLRLPTGLWNCSGPHWPALRPHFPCNLQADCVGGEDEALCPYTGRCGPGLLTITSGCYARVGKTVTDRPRSWTGANAYCRQHYGGYLASLNTAEEWTQVVGLLKHRLSLEPMFVGLQTTGPHFPFIYRSSFVWADGTVAHYRRVSIKRDDPSPAGGAFFVFSTNIVFDQVTLVSVNQLQHNGVFLCEFLPERESKLTPAPFELEYPNSMPPSAMLTACPRRHLAYIHLACLPDTRCLGPDDGRCVSHLGSWVGPRLANTRRTLWQPSPLFFVCGCHDDRVPYTVLCDGKKDCRDGANEDFCVLPPCFAVDHFMCSTGRQCVSKSMLCNGQQDCWDGSDEATCDAHPGSRHTSFLSSPTGTFRVRITASGLGYTDVRLLNTSIDEAGKTCPNGYVLCSKLCIPVSFICNGVNDCPGREDEAGCERYTCPGYYRCRQSVVCVHPTEMCDGIPHCPQKDDELWCDVRCPDMCTCFGLAFICPSPSLYIDRRLRYLDASGSGMTTEKISSWRLSLLVHLSLAKCRLTELRPLSLPNLHSFDLSDNNITSLVRSGLQNLVNLRVLSLARNPLVSMSTSTFRALHTLDLSAVHLPRLADDFFVMFGVPNLRRLYLADSGVEQAGSSIQRLPHLRLLDLQGCPMTEFSFDVLKGLHHLETLYTDNYKLCCEAILPKGFNSFNCHAPSDELSSCDDLLRSTFYRVCLFLLAFLAVGGNVGSLLYRWRCRQSRGAGNGGNVLVTHLCVADLLMGVYLLMIGGADLTYRGSYLWHDDRWRHSAVCQVAGFLSLLSCEVSAFVICFITLHQVLILRWPLDTLGLLSRAVHVTCAVVWLTGLVLAAVPLLPFHSHWHFYSQNGICLPLPITRREFPGHSYAFSLFVVLNFVLFLVVATGQALVYRSVRKLQQAANIEDRRQDVAIARRLLAIAMTDFCCWFPIGSLGLMASNGFPVPAEVNVVTVIFVLPLNSALNPFLYTFSMHRERRRREKKRCCHCERTEAVTEVGNGKSTVYSTASLDVV